MEPTRNTITTSMTNFPNYLFFFTARYHRSLLNRETLPKDDDSLKGELTNLPSHGDQHLISVHSITIHTSVY